MISALPTDASVTMAYVPFQIDNKTYEADTALMRGTLFPVLDKPFLRGGCK
ncbi:MAG: spore coat associated protein CotJA [Clostridia bacterium]|nr:spore coat associated protein CotJA [Clostridia bacterium]